MRPPKEMQRNIDNKKTKFPRKEGFSIGIAISCIWVKSKKIQIANYTKSPHINSFIHVKMTVQIISVVFQLLIL